MTSPNFPTDTTTTPPTGTKQGDLLMRATAVYHYTANSDTTAGVLNTNQTPIACVSSYYDPTSAITSKNQNGVTLTVPPVPPAVTPTTSTVSLPWNAAGNGRFNNGIVYAFPGRSIFATYQTQLNNQAKLIFPNGRLANEPLKTALAKISGTTVPNTGLELSDYSAIDTALCAISIMINPGNFLTTLTNLPPHGAIKEAAFLDAREAKQISVGTATTYDLELEQRQPLEIRVTDINLDTDTSGITRTAINTDYLLPYSGIIYATRDDALPDRIDITTQAALLSPTDFQLDPTRRPNGIRLINGQTLSRTSTNSYNAREKGLILVTNLPAYISGNFNYHRTDTTSTTQIEEFSETEQGGTNFYDRSTANTSFACRPNRTGCPTTGNGDFWRPATVIADSMTLLSGSFLDGFRSDSDYDLNNNSGIRVGNTFNPATISSIITPAAVPASVYLGLDARRQQRLKNGFWENSFATNANWWDSGSNDYYPLATGSSAMGSYVRNGVSPIQRRVSDYPIYVMEICRQALISDCDNNSTDPDRQWYIGFDIDGNGVLNSNPVNYPITGQSSVTLTEKYIKTYQLGQAIKAANGSPSIGSNPASDTILTNGELQWLTGTFGTGNKTIRARLGAGDTSGQALVATDSSYPRRVAFARDSSNNLVLSSSRNTSTNTVTSLGSGIYNPIGLGCPLDISGSAPNYNGCTVWDNNYNSVLKNGSMNALWFRKSNSTTSPGDLTQVDYTNGDRKPFFYFPPVDANGDGNPDLDAQPLLVPVSQVNDSFGNGSSLRSESTAVGTNYVTKWLQQASSTTVNGTFVVGNSPRQSAETSSGLQNFVRFLENWGNATSKISGSLIQLKRSTFATAPLGSILANKTTTTATAGTNPSDNLSLFDYALDTYPTENVSGLLPFYNPPTRTWGFDVALLSELPDLFAQRFTAPSTGRPNEFFREVAQDDVWVKTLLCAGQASNQTGIVTTGTTVTYDNAVPNEYRPSSSCKSIPDN